mgnify:CR=1 FL=1
MKYAPRKRKLCCELLMSDSIHVRWTYVTTAEENSVFFLEDQIPESKNNLKVTEMLAIARIANITTDKVHYLLYVAIFKNVPVCWKRITLFKYLQSIVEVYQNSRFSLTSPFCSSQEQTFENAFLPSVKCHILCRPTWQIQVLIDDAT